MPLTVADFQNLWQLSTENDGRSDCGFPRQFEEWLRKADLDQLIRSQIKSYQERCYGPLNDYLRKEDYAKNPVLDLRAKILNSALETLPVITTKVLWRNEGVNEEVKLWASKNIGKSFLIPSFWSTYINPENWKATTPAFKIMVSTPSKAKEISSYTDFQKGETEALYMSGSLFRIIGIEEVVTWGSKTEDVVVVEELTSGKPDIIAYDSYTLSQDDADHSTDQILSASDLGLM